MNCHIYTKSKFLGTSIGVQNIGFATLSLIDFQEEYTITWPDAYARSILMIPWIELCGSTSIECKQTMFEANTDFQSKPLFGGEANKVKCVVLYKGTELYNIEGKWNGLLKKTDIETKVVSEFIDIPQLTSLKKHVKPLIEQSENESRRKWYSVTNALRVGDIEKATMEKKKIELKQRNEINQRNEKNVEFQSFYFEKRRDTWIYKESIDQTGMFR